MGIRRTEEFRNEAVRIALTSGLSLKQVADDLGIGLSTLGKWVAARKHDERACQRRDTFPLAGSRSRRRGS